MKTKTILTLLTAFFITVGSAKATIVKNKKDKTIEITKNSTQLYLDSLTTALDKKGITLKVDTVQFNEQGQLQKISGEIHFSRTCYGTFSTDNLEKIIIRKTIGGLSVIVNEKE